MAKPGRKFLTDRPIRWEIAIPTSLATQVELLLSDPLLGKPKYGTRSALMTKLIRDWLVKQKKEVKTNDNAQT